jgi:hypothetical protein
MSTIQDQLANGISSQYADAVVKKVNKDNYLDIHLPALNPAKGTHLFFNTSKNTIKVGFYCRDEEFLAPILAENPALEAYSQGIRLAGNTPFDTVEEALEGASTLINAFFNETSQTSPVQEEVSSEEEDEIEPIDADLLENLLAALEGDTENVEMIFDRPELISAAENGDMDTINRIIQEGGDLHILDTGQDKYTAIHFAAWDGQNEVLKALIDAGANPDILGTDSRTPIHLAAANGRAEAVKLLIDAGVDINRRVLQPNEYHSEEGGTPIREAVLNQVWPVIELLIQHKADLTSLMEPCANGSYFFDAIRTLAADGKLAEFNEAKLSVIERALYGDSTNEETEQEIEEDVVEEEETEEFIESTEEEGEADFPLINHTNSSPEAKEYLRKWQEKSIQYAFALGITANIPSWVSTLNDDINFPKFKEKQVSQIKNAITSEKVIPILSYSPDELQSEMKNAWWVIPFVIWKEDVVSWVAVNKNGFYGAHEGDDNVNMLFSWDSLSEITFETLEDGAVRVERMNLHIENGGFLSFDEFVAKGNGSYLSIIEAIYEVRKETIDASKGESVWKEGTGGEGFQSFENAKELLEESRWTTDVSRPDPSMF